MGPCSSLVSLPCSANGDGTRGRQPYGFGVEMKLKSGTLAPAMWVYCASSVRPARLVESGPRRLQLQLRLEF